MIEIGGSVIPPAKIQRIEIPIARLPTQTLITLPVTVLTSSRRCSHETARDSLASLLGASCFIAPA